MGTYKKIIKISMKGEHIDAGVPVARIKSWTSPRKILPHSANQVRPHILISKYLKLKEKYSY
jgi:hypothetical protein